ncbi:MAG: AI-2E family transporter [Verrucomicrobiota bacterium]
MTPRNITLISYAVFVFVLVAIGALHLTASFVTVMFACLALHKLNFWNRKWLAVLVFMILVAAVFFGFVLFLRNAIAELPDIVSNSIRGIVQYAKVHDIELPFADNVDNLKDLAVDTVRSNLSYLQNFAKIATKEFVFQVVAVVVSIGVFLNPELDRRAGTGAGAGTLYELFYGEIARRFGSFFRSFERVMGAQLLISLINTVLTSCFLVVCCLFYPRLTIYAGMVIILTFACGMLPIIGNIVSNAFIVGLAFTVSPRMAVTALVFLVGIHKLEYFLNSKIIGGRIRHPMWLMLLALIAGERLMGIPGIILAPVVLSFIKVEMTKYEVGPGGEVVEVSREG